MMRIACLAHALAIFALSTTVIDRAFAQTPVRDAVRSSSAGTAVIAGTVVTDDKDRRPLRRARVLLTDADHENGRTVITDDAGRFAFTALSPDRYLLSAKKAGYVTLEYGAKRSTGAGVAIVVDEGQHLTSVVLRLPRGGVIAGVITDHNGQPASGVNVRPLRYQFTDNGRRTLTAIPSYASTNDLGQYRIWGLDAGEYVVMAMHEMSERWRQDLVRLTDADIKQAEADATGRATRGTLLPPRRAAYAPVYYPGMFATSEATSIRLSAGEERSGIDFQLSLIVTAKVEGSVVFPDAVDRQSLMVHMVNADADDGSVERSVKSVHVADDSRFSFPAVPPGQYTLTARTEAVPQRSGTDLTFGFPSLTTTHWALADVTVTGEDVSGVTLVLQLAFSVSGKVHIEASGSPPDVSRLIVMLIPAHPSGNLPVGALPTPVDPNGAFFIAGVTPGRYRLRAGLMTLRAAEDTWQVKSATVNGRDAVDEPIELRTSVDGAVVTVTDRMAGVSGVVRNASGQTAATGHVVMFAKDRKFWIPESSRLASVRPASDGRYVIRSMPAGDYFVTAVSDLEPGEWFDPAVLEQLSRSALTITLTEGEKTSQDLRLADRR